MFYVRNLSKILLKFYIYNLSNHCRSQWPRDLRHGSAAARLLGLWGSNPAGDIEDGWIFLDCYSLKMGSVPSSGPSLTIYQLILCNVTEDFNLHVLFHLNSSEMGVYIEPMRNKMNSYFQKQLKSTFLLQ